MDTRALIKTLRTIGLPVVDLTGPLVVTLHEQQRRIRKPRRCACGTERQPGAVMYHWAGLIDGEFSSYYACAGGCLSYQMAEEF